MTKIIEKNTTVPTSKSQVFSTAADNQPSVEIHILQGERPMAHDNKTLGRFILDGIPPAPRGLPQIEVTFDIDANGILNVSAKDKGTGREQKITITASSGLSKDEIEKMKREAETHAEEDKKKKELIEARNMAESLIYSTEKALRDAGDKVPESDKKEIEAKIDELKKVKDREDLEAIKRHTQELSTAAQKIGQAMYGSASSPQGQQQQQPPAGQESTGQTDSQPKDQAEEVVEGEVEDNKSDKK